MEIARMYSIRNEMAYHGCLCPGCFSKGIQRILYIRGSKEANEYWDKNTGSNKLPVLPKFMHENIVG